MFDAATLTPWDPRRGGGIVTAAMNEWARVVEEPPGRGVERIRSYIDTIGGPGARYHADGDWQWCGAFAGWCLIQAGARAVRLVQKDPPELGGAGSHYRLWCLATNDPRRLITRVEDVRAGDVVVVCKQRPGARPWGGPGAHIVIARSSVVGNDASPLGLLIPTVEGNAVGDLGNGRVGEGVVKRDRAARASSITKGFIFGVRLTPDDFIAEVSHG